MLDKTKRALADNITMDIKGNSKKSKTFVNVNSIIGSLPTDTIIEKNDSNDEMYDELVDETMLRAVLKKNQKN